MLLRACFCRPADAAAWLSRSRVRPELRLVTSLLLPASASDGAAASSSQMDYHPSPDIFSDASDPSLRRRNSLKGKLRSWFGPNGQYIRELPCPSCRGRGYTPCADCGIERSRSDCALCNGKGIGTCRHCGGDCVIWEESIDELPWEKARKSSPLKVKEDDAVDTLDIKVDEPSRQAKRVYQPLPPEVRLKISRALRMLNEKTGLFSNHMKMLHQDPKLRAQRAAAIKKAKGTPAARKQASDAQKVFFSDPENRRRRSAAMRGVEFHCRLCGGSGHRSFYCPERKEESSGFRCRLCGRRGHNRRTCRGRNPENAGGEESRKRRAYSCGNCGKSGHNRRSCPGRTAGEKNGVRRRKADAAGDFSLLPQLIYSNPNESTEI